MDGAVEVGMGEKAACAEVRMFWTGTQGDPAAGRERRPRPISAVSIGTETDGSINGPSTVNAIVGIKPTVGLISRSGLIPISMTQDTAGPMT